MPNSSIRLVKAGVNDIPLIARLAAIIWNQHYPDIISRAQIDYMLQKMYSSESLKDQIENQQHEFFIIRENGNELGFISVSRPGKDTSYFIHKFYILREVTTKGIGTQALEQLIALLSPAELKLTVNRQNYKSINFYFKNGFKIESVADFDIGNGFVMNDFVMVWKMS